MEVGEVDMSVPSDPRGRKSTSSPNISPRGFKPLWSALTVRNSATGPEVVDGERLVLLMRWLRKEGSPSAHFYDPAGKRVITDPMEVSWARFPLEDAINADRAMRQRNR
jgi:hypothetical protein